MSPLPEVAVLRKAARCRAKYWHCFKCYVISSAVRSVRGIFCLFDWIKISCGGGAMDRLFNLNSALLLPAPIWKGNCKALHGQGYLFELQCTQRGCIVTCFDTGDLVLFETTCCLHFKEIESPCVYLLKCCPSLSPELLLLCWHVCVLVCVSNPNINVTWHARGVAHFSTILHLLYTCSHVPAVRPSTTVAVLHRFQHSPLMCVS